MKNQSISFTPFFDKNNVKKIMYEDNIYMVISDFLPNTRLYSCSSKAGPITEEIISPSSRKEVTKFRVVGDSLVLFCTYAGENKMTWKWISFMGSTGSIRVIQSIVYRNKHFGNRAKYSNLFHPEVTISPVVFEDAGKYQQALDGKTINLVTIQVTAFPSTKVHLGSDVQLSCRLSHLLLNVKMVLIWTKYNGYTYNHVKTQELDLNYMENSILIKEIKMNEITNWACLVFNKDHLVASAPIDLNYIKPKEPDITNNQDISTTRASSTTTDDLNMTIPDSVDRGWPEEIKIANALLTSCIVIILITLIVFCIVQKQKKLGGKNMDVQTNVPLSAELQYTSVRFYKKPTEHEKNIVMNHNQDSDSEVVYAEIQHNYIEDDATTS
ncbi:uncharacterized protein [Pyxicephalus adspersus]|uniref:uncharacterized protein n=1 Tax=Pyxicephalus adspersus TaxID=30357 RepID=UPI003B5B6239